MTSWGLYWLTRCDGIKDAAQTVVILLIVLLVVVAFFGAMAIGDNAGWSWAGYRRCLRRIGVPLALVAGITTFIPTTKQLAAILVLPKIANSQTVAELGEATKTLALEWLEELRPAKAVP